MYASGQFIIFKFTCLFTYYYCNFHLKITSRQLTCILLAIYFSSRKSRFKIGTIALTNLIRNNCVVTALSSGSYNLKSLDTIQRWIKQTIMFITGFAHFRVCLKKEVKLTAHVGLLTRVRTSLKGRAVIARSNLLFEEFVSILLLTERGVSSKTKHVRRWSFFYFLDCSEV